jgi:glycogen debranching enzyme
VPGNDTEMISILDGSAFCVSDRRGDIDAAPGQPHGFFYRDTRHLSRWRLSVDGQSPRVLSVGGNHYFAAQFFLAPETGTVYRNPYLSLIRARSVGEGIHDDLTVLNHLGQPVEVELRVDAGADFADLFEVKDKLEKKGESYREVRERELVLGYRRDGFVHERRIAVSAAEAELDENGILFRLTIGARSRWATCIEIVPDGGRPTRPKYRHGETRAKPNMAKDLDAWLADAPTLESDWDPLPHIYRQSLIDLAALRFYPEILPDATLPAAGLPRSRRCHARPANFRATSTTPRLAATGSHASAGTIPPSPGGSSRRRRS